MTKKAAWNIVKENAYHKDNNCNKDNNIESENLKQGTQGKSYIRICKIVLFQELL